MSHKTFQATATVQKYHKDGSNIGPQATRFGYGLTPEEALIDLNQLAKFFKENLVDKPKIKLMEELPSGANP